MKSGSGLHSVSGPVSSDVVTASAPGHGPGRRNRQRSRRVRSRRPDRLAVIRQENKI